MKKRNLIVATQPSDVASYRRQYITAGLIFNKTVLRLILFFYGLTAINSGYAQCGDVFVDCLPPSYTCIGSLEGIPNSSSTNLVDGGVYLVNGTFAFNKTQSLNFCTFVVSPGGQLIIGPNTSSTSGYVSFDKCWFKGCTGLWQRMYIRSGWSLLFNRSKLEDSYDGIKIEDGGNLSARENVFEDNFCSITIDQNVGVSKSFVAVYTSEFTSSTNNLLPGFQSPYTYTKPLRGIYIRTEVPNFFITGSYFHNIQNGILLNNCNMISGIYPNNVFKDIQPINYPNNTNGATGNAINIIGSTKTVKLVMTGKYIPNLTQPDNLGNAGSYLVGPSNNPFTFNQSALTFNANFINCYRGIRVQNALSKITLNDMIDCNFGVVVTLTPSNKINEIWTNYMRGIKTVGIDINANLASFSGDIFNNFLYLEPSFYTRIGIRHISMSAANSAQALQVRSNKIIMGQSSNSLFTVPSWGIEIAGVAGTTVKDINRISVFNPNMNYTGIYIHNGSDNCIVNNTLIRALDQSSNAYSSNRFGILVDEAENCEISCNRFTKLGRCLNILWECNESNITKNIFESGVQGLVYGNDTGQPGLSGNQEGKGNRWLKPNQFSQWQAKFNGDIGGVYGDNSKYTVHADDSGGDIEYWPNTKTPNSGWFWVVDFLPFPSGSCSTGIIEPGTGGLPEIVNDVINNDVTGWPNDGYMWRAAKLFTYNYLQTHPEVLTSNSVAQNFIAVESSTPLRKLWALRSSMENIGVMSETVQTQLNTNFDLLQNTSFEISNMMQQWDAINSTTGFYDSIEIKRLQYEALLSSIDGINQNQVSAYNVAIPQLMAQLNGISTSNAMDANQKFTLGIELKRWQDPDYQPGAIEINQLLSLAAQCHRIEGQGVLEARNLLKIFDIEGVQEDPSNCNGLIEPRNAAEENQIISAVDFRMYPNPGTDKICIGLANVDAKEYLVEIRNSTGMLVKSLALQSTTAEINTSDLVPGLYHISLRTERENLGSRTWIKVK